MAHGFNSMIKREIDCNSASSSIKSNHQIPQQTIIPTAAALVNNNTNSTATVTTTGSATAAAATTVSSSPTTTSTIQQQSCGSAKMGSRRIFTPQFKLQVLESYRNDSDCKGNQRATARKYGIHRRQIQKWLQCETNLRSSVANLNQNSIKHQFHNISHHHHHSHQQTLPTTAGATATATTASTAGTNMNSNNHHHQHHNQHYQQQQQQQQHHQQQYKVNNLPLDTARHSVALTPVTLSAVAAPQSSITPTTTQSAAAAAAQLVAAAAAAAVIPSAIVRATTITTAAGAAAATKCINGSTHHHHNNKTTIKLSTTMTRAGTPTIPIQPAAAAAYRMNVAAVGGNLVPAECSAATLLTHTPAITSMPLVVSHYHPQHHQHQHHQQQHQQQQLQQHIENRLLMPSASLPLPLLGSPVSTATNRTDELRDYQPITVTGNCYNMNEVDYRNLPIYENLHYYNGRSVASTIGGGVIVAGGSVASSGGGLITAAAATTRMDCGVVAAAPIDLSLNFRRREVSEHHRRHEQSDYSDSIAKTATVGNSVERLCYNNMIKMAATETSSWHKIVADNSNDSNNNRDKYDEENKKIDVSLYGSSLHHDHEQQKSGHAVDLTCRKRKNVGSDNNNSIEDETEVQPPEKVQKTSNIDEETDTVARGSSSFAAAVGGGQDAGEKQNENNNNNNHQQAKPVKLFKPYLLDDDDNERKYSINSSEQRDPIIWSHHLTCITSGGVAAAATAAINVGAYDGNSPQQQGGSGSDNFSLISPTTSTNVDKFATFQQQSTMETGSPTFHTQQQQQQSTYIDRTTSTPISPQSSIASHSPTSTSSSSSSYWCSKGFTAGSPVSSGYESASSFSDSNDYYRSPPPPSSQHLQTSYSIDLKMQAIDSSYYNHDLTCRADQLTAVNGKYEIAHAHAPTTRTTSNHVIQKWLDPEANIRQGIALYV